MQTGMQHGRRYTRARSIVITCTTALCASLLITACGKPEQGQAKAPVPATSTPIATVNGEGITDADVDLAMQRMFSDTDRMLGDANLRSKVLESLVTSRAIKQLVLKELTPDESEKIHQQAKAYEEELLVKEYLQRHVTPEPVTSDMVQKFYQDNPARFGQETIRDFELLKAPTNLDDSRRDALLKAIPAIRAEADWSKTEKTWADQFGLQLERGSSAAGLLNNALDEALKKMKPGETSEVVSVDGQFHLLRLKAERQTPPKALSEVSADIRRQLAPLQLKKAVKQLSETARAQAKVEWNQPKPESP